MPPPPPRTATTTPLPRMPVFGLDIIRAAAVSLVLASHAGDEFARWCGTTNLRLLSYGAYFGIELFFVLSGLLIGGLLIRELNRPSGPTARGWTIFMARRWMRTLPLYYVWLAVAALVWAPILWPFGGQLRHILPAYLTLTQNLAWPMQGGGLFDVTWSLAVEEWFYLGFSALLFSIAAYRRPLAMPLALGLFVLGPIALRWAWRTPGSADHLMPYWLDSIAMGVAVAWLRARRPATFAAGAWLLPVGLGLVWLILHGGLARLGASPRWCRTLDFDLAAIALCLLLPAACRWRHARGPAAAAIRLISRLSYALYLTHLTILTVIDARRGAWHLPPATAIALAIAAISLFSVLLSSMVERPIMARRPNAHS